MKITRDALQNYFDTQLPSTAEIADAFTFHCFEIEEVEGDLLDIKVLPNRAADCSKEEGIAAELSAILNVPLKDTEVSGYADAKVSVTVEGINETLGSDFTEEEITDVFRRLRFNVEKNGEEFTVQAPMPRTDITIHEDVAEEVGRLLDFERIPATELSPMNEAPDQARYRGIERMKDELVAQGYTEVSTQSFTKKGDVELANPLDKTRPFLRTSLKENISDALTRANQYAPLSLPPKTKIKLFEVGTVFPKEGEYVELHMSEPVPEWGDGHTTDNLSIAKLEEYGKDYIPKQYTLEAYKPFSLYPFITRDIAFWVGDGTDENSVVSLLKDNAGELLIRIDQFDRFEKEGRVSYAFRLVFQSAERTLTDDEVLKIMTNITEKVKEKGFEPR